MKFLLNVVLFLFLVFTLIALATAIIALGAFLLVMIDDLIELIQNYRRNDK